MALTQGVRRRWPCVFTAPVLTECVSTPGTEPYVTVPVPSTPGTAVSSVSTINRLGILPYF